MFKQNVRKFNFLSKLLGKFKKLCNIINYPLKISINEYIFIRTI